MGKSIKLGKFRDLYFGKGEFREVSPKWEVREKNPGRKKN